MDINTKNLSKQFKNILLDYLFDYNQELKNKWNNDEEILFNDNIYSKFTPLLYGDWNRNPIENKINLSDLQNKSYKPSSIFDMIIKELTTKSKPYAYNVNPNWFFLFYEKFYNYKLKNNLYLTFVYNEETKCLQFNNYTKISKIIREETLSIIIFHSRFVLNQFIVDYLHNSSTYEEKNKNSLFEDIFIKNCLIQKPININEISKRYVDLCYLINNKDHLILEINEYHHDPLLDKFRKKSIIVNSKEIKNTFFHFDTTKYSSDTLKEVGDLLVTNLCKIIHKKKILSDVALQVYLTDIENLDSQFVDLYISININYTRYTLNDVFNTFLNIKKEEFTNKIIKQHVKYGNINYYKDFDQNCELYDELLRIVNYKDAKQTTICNFIIENKDKLEITYFGLKNFIMTMKNKDIQNRNDLLIHLDNVENNYYKCITTFLENNDFEYYYEELEHLQNLSEIYNATMSNIINNEKYLEKIKEINKNIKNKKENNKYNKSKNSSRFNIYDYKFHNFIPYLVYKENSIFKYKDVIPFILEKDKKLISADARDEFLRDYRLLTINEIKKILI